MRKNVPLFSRIMDTVDTYIDLTEINVPVEAEDHA